MTCPACRAVNPPGDAFCSSCGLDLRGARPPHGERKGFAIASLVLGILSLPTLGLLGLGAILGVIMGVVALVKAREAPAQYGGKGLAIAGIVMSASSFFLIPVIGIVAAIAIPSFLRARVSANESATIGDVRSVLSAEAAYSTANGGFYDKLDCLSLPSACIPGYSGTGPTFLAPMPSRKSGYARVFHAGPAASAPEITAANASASSVRSFAYVAVPEQQFRSGVRAFCGDSTGRICFTVDGRPPAVKEGLCPLAPVSGSDLAPCASAATGEPWPREPAATAPPDRDAAVRVGGRIREPKKIKDVAPVYPDIAKQARVQGIVILECLISPEGKVADIKVLRGIPLLDKAAIEAVRQWEYTPTLLEGKPVPVIMAVTVNFRLR